MATNTLKRRLDRLESQERGQLIVFEAPANASPDEISEVLRNRGIDPRPNDTLIHIRQFTLEDCLDATTAIRTVK